MPRTGRIVCAGYPHHIVHRGHNRDAVFLTDSDRISYLETLREFRAALSLQVYGYCLMTNHVHLIINPGVDNSAVGRLMKRLAGRHTRRINRLTSRTGTAWEGRFKCSLIDTNSYLLACSRYVDLNPVRAGLVSRPEEFPWSSFRALAGLADSNWVDATPVTSRWVIPARIARNAIGISWGAVSTSRSWNFSVMRCDAISSREQTVLSRQLRIGRAGGSPLAHRADRGGENQSGK